MFKKRQKNPKKMSQSRPRDWRWLKWLLWSPVIIVLLVLLTPVVLIASMRWIDPVGSMFIWERQYELHQAGSEEKVQYRWVDAEQITPKMMLAVVAAEDQKFPNHFGFDLEAIEKALEHNRGSKKIRGASTITQQVAKNIFLWPSRSWIRKGMEVYFTALIEVFWSKQRIVEVYVNIAQFDDNVFGVGAASEHFFKKTPDKLTMRETALLAAVLPNPVKYRVEKPSSYVDRRAHWIQQQMVGLGEDYLITGVVPIKQYQAATGATQVQEVPMEEPVDETVDEPVDASASELMDTMASENPDETLLSEQAEVLDEQSPESSVADEAADMNTESATKTESQSSSFVEESLP